MNGGDLEVLGRLARLRPAGIGSGAAAASAAASAASAAASSRRTQTLIAARRSVRDSPDRPQLQTENLPPINVDQHPHRPTTSSGGGGYGGCTTSLPTVTAVPRCPPLAPSHDAVSSIFELR